MAEWKKVVVSGSDVSQLNNDSNYIVDGQSGVILTGSFTGSFQGDGSGLTGVIATNGFALTGGEGISPFTYDGSAALTVEVSGAAQLSDNVITKWNNTDGKFEDSSLTDNGTAITGTTSLQLTGANTSLTGSFTGSFIGDGSGLTGLATLLSGSTDTGNFEVDLLTQTLTIQGTANEVETSAAGTTVTIGLPNDVTISNNLLVSNDLTVLGTASFQNTENLLVADRFVLFASGSNSTGDGGIVVQQGTQNVGEVFGYDSSTVRWGLTSSFGASNSSFTPDAFMAAVTTLSSVDPNTSGPDSRYDKVGNIYVSSNDESIWIYS
jgi:hypothetical protein